MAQEWKQIGIVKLLYKQKTEPFSVHTALDLPFQRTIKCDVDRTRSDILTSDEKILLENMLTLFCKQSQISYKQGMNEILGVFLLLCRQGLPDYIAFLCFKEFISRFLLPTFADEVRKI
jgi:hypothetical protein